MEVMRWEGGNGDDEVEMEVEKFNVGGGNFHCKGGAEIDLCN